MSGERLTAKQEKFVENYLSNGGNATDAARLAGYSGTDNTLAVVGSDNLRKTKIEARVTQRMIDAKIHTDEVIGTLASQMRGDIADVLPDNEIIKRARERGVSHLIKKLTVKRYYPKNGDTVETTTVEMYSSQEAARTLCAVFGGNRENAPAPVSSASERDRQLAAINLFKAESRKLGHEATDEEAARYLSISLPETEIVM
jgi:nucleotide-binding universal stress UspA family protein